MTADGCKIECDIDGRPNEENVPENRYECDCRAGYTRDPLGVCVL
jgi:hypothetical protein